MSNYEFAVEYGWKFRYVEVRAESAKQARRLLWDEILTEEEKNAVSSIELVGESESA